MSHPTLWSLRFIAIAAIGVALGFLSWWLGQRWLSIAALGITVLGVAGGFFILLFGGFIFDDDQPSIREELTAFRKRQQATWRKSDWKP